MHPTFVELHILTTSIVPCYKLAAEILPSKSERLLVFERRRKGANEGARKAVKFSYVIKLDNPDFFFFAQARLPEEIASGRSFMTGA